jgi:hypothetical protein
MNDTLTQIAEMLHAMQTVVLADAQASGGANPERVYGKIVAAHWGAVRQGLGLAGKWASLEDTKAALAAKLGAGGSKGASTSAAMDFDMGAWDPAAGMCTVCGSSEGRGPSGECVICGAS